MINGVSANDQAGFFVSSAGDVNGDGLIDVIVGTFSDDPNGVDSGAAFVVFGKTTSTAVQLSAVEAGTGGFVINGVSAGDRAGGAVSAAGDVNGDGLADVIVGAGADDPNGSASGASFVVFGKTTGTVVQLSTVESGTGGFVIRGASTDDLSGCSVSSAGDVNGDGLTDLIVGNRSGAPNGVLSGAAYVVFGKTSGTVVELSTVAGGTGGFAIQGASAGDQTGISVLSGGDVNGDGLADLVVGAHTADPNGDRSGVAYVVFGKTTGTTVQLSNVIAGSGGFVMKGVSAIDYAGFAVSAVGDVNGDGLSDVIIGAFGDDLRGSSSGNAFVVFGKTNSTAVQLSTVEAGTGGFVINGFSAGDEAGRSVSAVGDINGDGLADVMVGVRRADVSGNNSGASYVVFGKTSGTALELSSIGAGVGGFVIQGVSANDYAGVSIAAAGDVNGDGLADLIVGAYKDDPNGDLSGASFVIFGSSNWVGSSVTLGTSGVDTQTGTSSADYIISGDGADTVDGGGGADVLYTGKGNDLIKIDNNSFSAIDGGTGTDTLRFDAAISLDLTSIANDNLIGINAIDLSADSGNSTLTLNIFDLYDMTDEVSGDHHDLTITAAVGDTIALATSSNEPTGGEWVKHGGDYEYTLSDGTVAAEIHLVGQATVTGVDRVLIDAVQLSTIVAGTGGFAINGRCSRDYSGISVSDAGDVNGDGLADLIVGANNAYARGSYSGQSYVVFGKTTGTAVQLSTVANGTGGFAINGRCSNDYSGISVSSAGDVNGDGLADLLVGAWSADPNALSSSGQSYVIFGKTAGTAVELSAVAAGTGGFAMNGLTTSDLSGWAVSGSGDINGDGLADVLVTARAADPNGANSGQNYVVFGKTSGTAVELSTVATGTGGFAMNGLSANFQAGESISGAGDVNGDGLMDLIIGSKSGEPHGSSSGQSYVVFGKTAGTLVQLTNVLTGTGGFVINGQISGDQAGKTVSAAGDVNGDGLADLIVGGYAADPNSLNAAGQAYVVFGKTAGTAVELSSVVAGTGGFAINGQVALDYAGFSVGSAGDFNGDGLADLIVGAKMADPNSLSASGQSYVVFGKTSGTAIQLSSVVAGSGGFAINGQCASDQSGISVSGAGDVNGDGMADLIVGASYADPNSKTSSGQSYVIFGSSNFTAGSVTLGTSSADTMSGTSSADYFISGDGADTVDGNGGTDVLYTGNGNDLIKIDNGTFTRIDGGAGTDTLRFDAAISLNLTNLANDKLVGINAIDMSADGGSSTLTLNLFDVFDMTDEVSGLHHDLDVTGASGDTLTVSAASNQPATGSWVQSGSDYNFTVGSDVLAQIHVTGALTVNV